VTFGANCPSVPALATLVLCALVVLGVPSARATDSQREIEASHARPLTWHLPPPPTCASHENPTWIPGKTPSQESLLSVQTPGPPPTYWIYTRFCGPATVVVHLHQASTRIHGGRCVRHSGAGEYSVRVGLATYPPAKPGEWVGLFFNDPRAAHPGTFRVGERATGTVNAMVQLRGPVLSISAGTMAIGASMRAGTFTLRLHDGTTVSGSWSCG
jgi:hypothetical protein